MPESRMPESRTPEYRLPDAETAGVRRLPFLALLGAAGSETSMFGLFAYQRNDYADSILSQRARIGEDGLEFRA